MLNMAKKKDNNEEIIKLLRQAERLMAKTESSRQATKKIAISYQTFSLWRKESANNKMDQTKRLKELEDENQRLKKIVVELELDMLMWKEFASISF